MARTDPVAAPLASTAAAHSATRAGPSVLSLVGRIAFHVLLAVVAFITLFPIVWLLLGSLQTIKELYDGVNLLPAVPQWQNYYIAWTKGGFSVSTTATRYGEFTILNANPVLDQTFGAKWLFDLAFSYKTGGWEFTVGGDNVLDEYPDENIFISPALNTSTTASTERPPPTANGFEIRTSQLNDALSFRSVLRSRIEPSGQIRSDATAARSPVPTLPAPHFSEIGCAENTEIRLLR